MRYVKLGTTDIEISSIGLGSWGMGADANWGPTDDNDSVKTIEKALDAGITFIDTAPAYGLGHSEEIVGKALKGKRDKVILASKCGLIWGSDDDEGYIQMQRDGITLRRNLKRDSIRKEIEKSFKRLGTDYIDLYVTHWQTVEPFLVPIEETVSALLELKKEGKIRAIGISNITKEHFELMKNGAVLSNAGHFDVEINKNHLSELSDKVINSRNNIETYVLSDKEIHLLAEGRLVNLAAGDGHPAEIMDMSFSVQGLSLEYLLKNKGKLKPEIIYLPEEVNDTVAKIKLETLNINIDSLTEEQKEYYY